MNFTEVVKLKTRIRSDDVKVELVSGPSFSRDNNVEFVLIIIKNSVKTTPEVEKKKKINNK